ncbi:hypothetical protein GCM10010273_42390 [Streptomyces lavendulocolor]
MAEKEGGGRTPSPSLPGRLAFVGSAHPTMTGRGPFVNCPRGGRISAALPNFTQTFIDAKHMPRERSKALLRAAANDWRPKDR